MVAMGRLPVVLAEFNNHGSDFEFHGLKVGEATLCPLPIEETGVSPADQERRCPTDPSGRSGLHTDAGGAAETRYWQHVHGMISAQVDVVSVTNQFHRALFMDGSLDLEAFEHLKQARSLGSTSRRRWRVQARRGRR
jgi:hypothetical protein